MADPTSVKDIDLSPIPGKRYFSIDREWREERKQAQNREARARLKSHYVIKVEGAGK